MPDIWWDSQESRAVWAELLEPITAHPVLQLMPQRRWLQSCLDLPKGKREWPNTQPSKDLMNSAFKLLPLGQQWLGHWVCVIPVISLPVAPRFNSFSTVTPTTSSQEREK